MFPCREDGKLLRLCWLHDLCQDYSILLLYIKSSKVHFKVLVPQLCLTFCDPLDCCPPGSFVHGILQARILEWVAILFSMGSSRPRSGTLVWNPGLLHCRQILYCLSRQGTPKVRDKIAATLDRRKYEQMNVFQ
ncbi:unnamed protein product [Rangifer tarandus platyrhynchus]|uniref:Uncharacterized protein n=2 Tax=Rangifer tarandus platyrhynchus TaxID=3082113 RepID=A0AC59YBM8_RANTA|nr:unnamed protein product [Rangifer tarandus platyrhynchus]